MSHKHCVFCGETGSESTKSTACLSPLNCLPADTVGNKPHGYPLDYKEKARLAAARAATCANEIEYISGE